MSQAMGREVAYSVLYDATSVEEEPLDSGIVRRRVWVVCVGEAFYRLTWSSRGTGHGLPECKAYPCDEAGAATSSHCVARCYCVTPHVAFAAVMDQLLSLPASRPRVREGAVAV